MGILEVVKRHKMKELKAEILEQGIEQGIEKVIKNALDVEYSLESIAVITDMSVKEVKAIIQKNGWDKK